MFGQTFFRALTRACMIAVLGLGAAAQAQTPAVPVEVSTNAGSAVTLHLHPFLAADELATLRVVATNDQALSLFVASRTGHAALAVSPDEGFIRDGALVPSATALTDLPDADAARTAALAACDAARKAATPCVVVLEVSPPM
jgi:hypothetical protein